MKINVIGLGVMGYQVAALFALLGYRVAVFTRSEVNTKKLDRNIRLLRKLLLDDSSALISGPVTFKICEKMSDIYDAPTIETVSESLTLKKKIYSEVREFTDDIFISNTSSLVPTEIAEDVIGLHFFNPIYLKFLEFA